MRRQDLKFVDVVHGKKDHFVFSQGDRFYELTLMDREKRGNFQQIDQFELDTVKKAVVHLGIDFGYFKPEDVNVRLFRDFESDEHRQSRLRSIFYVLSALRYMYPSREGNELFFAVTERLIGEVDEDS